MRNLSPFSLGATLYMPATRTDILEVVSTNKIEGLRSLVICLEDSVSDKELDFALANLDFILNNLTKKLSASSPLVFIRPRNMEMAQLIVSKMQLISVTGFVLAKFSLKDLDGWENLLDKSHLLCMPTLETAEVFDPIEMRELAFALDNSCIRNQILAIRIGGNDLMNVLGVRRNKNETLYEGPIGYIIKMLVSTFGAKGFSLTAPVCELLESSTILERELAQDVVHGLVGKTAIHPNQIDTIHKGLAVEHSEYQDALRIINSELAVFKNNGAMCEPATHKKWANNIMIRAALFGSKQSSMRDVVHSLVN